MLGALSQDGDSCFRLPRVLGWIGAAALPVPFRRSDGLIRYRVTLAILSGSDSRQITRIDAVSRALHDGLEIVPVLVRSKPVDAFRQFTSAFRQFTSVCQPMARELVGHFLFRACPRSRLIARIQ